MGKYLLGLLLLLYIGIIGNGLITKEVEPSLGSGFYNQHDSSSGSSGGGAGEVFVQLGSPNQTLLAPSTTFGIAIATSTANPSGLFNVDTSGNIATSGTLTVGGLSRLKGGFISNASSSVGAGLQVSGALNASSSLFVSSTLMTEQGVNNASGLFNVDTTGAVFASGTIRTYGRFLMGTSPSSLSAILANGVIRDIFTSDSAGSTIFRSGGGGLFFEGLAGIDSMFIYDSAPQYSIFVNTNGVVGMQYGLESNASSSFGANVHIDGVLGASSTLLVGTKFKVSGAQNLVSSTADMFFSSSTSQGSGPVVKSPDGTCYRLVAANGGSISGTAVTCPTGN